METISSFLTQDHRACDEEFANMENSVASGDWIDANSKLVKFSTDLLHHFDMEEKVMFPAFENKTGITQGPTAMMRMEHDQMRGLLEDLKADVNATNKDHFFGVSESLMMLMQQHNMKEEQMLYAMADSHLGDVVSDVVENMKAI
ncbi:hemerythrin domain-containing protein [Poseidonibacter lekithochrous]|uniref:hemerythrin domain-containing protein n=1 Tax=Poseidonibacter TaxID=2321187 RepID=UPI001C0A1FE3|nr:MULTISPECIES: hemerythrin domain-containing protein [Poseidonibacter]MBU3015375.1 hemerythrin domain-containing protein [Poseidonibacter lekithochrous]MDO6828674.1 hemerythrin domain-containing protein [Poseidonibacter sp. 1_MG-2023]